MNDGSVIQIRIKKNSQSLPNFFCTKVGLKLILKIISPNVIVKNNKKREFYLPNWQFLNTQIFTKKSSQIKWFFSF